LAEQLGAANQLRRIQFLATEFRRVEVESFDDEMQDFPVETQIRIRTTWQDFSKNRPMAIDGNLASLSGIRVGNGVLSMRLRSTSFSRYVGTKSVEPRWVDVKAEKIDNGFAFPLTVGAVTVTNDGFIVLAVKKKEVRMDEYLRSSKGYVSIIPAGYFEPGVDIDSETGRMSPEVTLKRELDEELGVQQVTKQSYLGLICDTVQKQQPLLTCRVFVQISRAELELIAEKGLEEHTQLVPVPADDLTETRRILAPYDVSVHALGTLLLHHNTK
jgi:8-oxo-dGTP pyrophosphatase MutT (NUDIX family)